MSNVPMEDKLKISKDKDGFFQGVVLTKIETLSNEVGALSDRHQTSMVEIKRADEKIVKSVNDFNTKFENHILLDQEAFTSIKTELQSKISYKWFATTFLIAVVGWTAGFFYFYTSIEGHIKDSIDDSLQTIVERQDRLEAQLTEWKLID